MPTYSYRCTECDTAFDIQQSFSDSSLTVCPTCQGKLRKVYSAIGVSFTGSGFYRNDARAEATASRDTRSGAKKAADKAPEKASEKPAKAAGEKSSAAPAATQSKPSASVSPTTSSTGSSAPKKP